MICDIFCAALTVRHAGVARGAAPACDPDGDKGGTVQTVPGNEITGGEK